MNIIIFGKNNALFLFFDKNLLYKLYMYIFFKIMNCFHKIVNFYIF